MLSVDDDTCIECGICVDLLPQYFEVAQGRVRVRPGSPPPGDDADAACLEEAIRDCPGGSIRT